MNRHSPSELWTTTPVPLTTQFPAKTTQTVRISSMSPPKAARMNSLVPSNLPLPPPLQTTCNKCVCFLSICMFLQSQDTPATQSSPPPICPAVHLSLLSVARLHLGPAGSHLLLGVWRLWLRLQPLSAPPASTSTRRPGSCALTTLDSNVDHWPFGPAGLAGLPRHVGSTWVGHRTTFAINLWPICCPVALHLFSFG